MTADGGIDPQFQHPPQAEPKVPDAIREEEERLWTALAADPENVEKHKAYFNHIVHNPLMKEAMRRYGAVINDKEFSINARRQFRNYQQTLVNLMFMSGSRQIPEKKKSALELFLIFSSAILMLAGLMIPYLRLGFFIGLTVLVVFGFFKYRSVKNLKDENRRIPE
jgi:hypothetical protein